MENIKFALSSHSREEKKASSKLIADCFDQAVSTAYDQRYNWQFLENPAGTGTVLFAYHNEEPIGQITCIPCRYTFMDSSIPTALAGEWLCVSPKYRGRGLMSQLISRISKLGNSQFPFVMDMPNKSSKNGFQKALYKEMAVKLLVRPLRLSKCFVYKKLPRMLLRPFDAVWVKASWTERLDISNKFTVKEYCLPTFDDKFDRLFSATNEIGIIRQVRNSVFLNWRYNNVPGREYKTIVCYGENGTLDGYIVIRLTIAYGIKVGFILDLVSKSDLEIGNSLISWALGYFWCNDAAIAAALCFPKRKEYEMLKRAGFFVCPQRMRPNPFILHIKRVHEKYNQYDVNILTDSKRWQFMFGDYQVY